MSRRGLLVALAMLGLLLVPGVARSAAAPDLIATKTNDVNGSVRKTDAWHWTVHVANIGDASAEFAEHETILQDQLPSNLFVQYGPLTVANLSGITGTLRCAYVSSGPPPRGFVCVPDGGPVSIAAGGSFDVTLQAFSSADGVYANPDPAGRCAVDPGSGHVAESNEGNNSCSDTVTVATEELTVSKTNDVLFSTTLGSSWTWTIDIANQGHRTATFPDGSRVLIDSLPDQNIGYGPVAVGSTGGITGPVACAIDAGFNLTCSASGGAVSLPPGGSILVSVTATPSAAGQYANPRSGGICFVDPDFAVPESHTNNRCSDSVTVGVPDLTVTKTNTTLGRMFLTPGGNWFWDVRVANEGTANAVFDSGQVVLVDDLPAVDIAYGPLQYFAGPHLACTVSGSAQLRCEASGGPVVIGPGGSFDVIFKATPSAGRVFANPRSGGMCSVDPDAVVGETDNLNNECQDTVTVLAPTSTELTCVPTSVSVGSASDCKATVTDTSASPSTPTGQVFFNSGGGGSFSATTCSLAFIAPGQAACSVSFTPTLAGDRLVRAIYLGDEIHGQSASPVTHISAVAPPDTTPPVFSFSQSPDGSNSWFKTAPAILHVTATDTDDSGVSSLSCTLDGAPTTLTNTATTATTKSGDVSTSANNDHTVVCTASDPTGNTATSSTQHLKLDASAPTYSCTPSSPPAGWSNSEFSASCTASDAGGSDNVSPTSFTLATSVGSGNEDPNASTNAVTINDDAGNQTTAQFTGIKIDKKTPSITITLPGGGATYTVDQVVAASYNCNDGTGSGIATCAGPVVNGANIDTLTIGSRTFTVNSTDNVGNVASNSVTFTVRVTPGSLCLLTKRFIQSSAKYQALTPAQRAAANQLANAICAKVALIVPTLTPAQKAKLVLAYQTGVRALVPLGLLTQSQATTLVSLSNAL